MIDLMYKLIIFIFDLKILINDLKCYQLKYFYYKFQFLQSESTQLNNKSWMLKNLFFLH